MSVFSGGVGFSGKRDGWRGEGGWGGRGSRVLLCINRLISLYIFLCRYHVHAGNGITVHSFHRHICLSARWTHRFLFYYTALYVYI